MINTSETLSQKNNGYCRRQLKIPDLGTSSAVCRAVAVRGLRMCTPQGDG